MSQHRASEFFGQCYINDACPETPAQSPFQLTEEETEKTKDACLDYPRLSISGHWYHPLIVGSLRESESTTPSPPESKAAPKPPTLLPQDRIIREKNDRFISSAASKYPPSPPRTPPTLCLQPNDELSVTSPQPPPTDKCLSYAAVPGSVRSTAELILPLQKTSLASLGLGAPHKVLHQKRAQETSPALSWPDGVEADIYKSRYRDLRSEALGRDFGRRCKDSYR